MKALVVEDDATSRLLLREWLRTYGDTDVAANGREAVRAVAAALEANAPYSVICLDIMMPEMDGQQALREIRGLEAQHGRDTGRGACVLMTTALRDKDNVMTAFREQCDGYLVKPIERSKLLHYLHQFGLVAE